MSKWGKVVLMLLLVLLVSTVAIFACGKKKEEPQAQAQAPATGAPSMTPGSKEGMPQGMPPSHGTGAPSMMPGSKEGMPKGMPPPHGTGTPGGAKVERKVVVPPEVAAKWKAVKLTVAEKKTGGKSNTYTLKLNESFTVPGSKLTLKVDAFLPNFTMAGGEITSASNEPNNPACRLIALEGGKETQSWLFSKFPDMHPFDHPQYKIILVEGVPKS